MDFVHSKRLMLMVSGAAVAVILLAAFASLRGNEAPVRAGQAVRENIVSSIATNGKVRPVEDFEAHAPAATTVRRVLVHQGDHVQAGELLLQLDDTEARARAAKGRASLKAAEADLNSIQTGGSHEEVITNQSDLIKARSELDAAKRNLETLRRLQDQGAASPAEVEDGRMRVKLAEAAVRLLEEKETSRYSHPEIDKVKAEQDEARTAYEAAEDTLRGSSVRAPRAGIVYSLPVRVGAYVNTGDLLVQVADLSRVQVVGYVDEPEIGRLAPGQKVTVSWDALPGRSWQGAITRVPSTVFLLGTRNVGEIICTVDNSDLKLLPNINVNLLITTAQREQVLTVPREAVHQENGQQYVFEIVNGELKRRAVAIGITNATRTEIVSGLPENAWVALSALDSHPLSDDLPVRVVQR